ALREGPPATLLGACQLLTEHGGPQRHVVQAIVREAQGPAVHPRRQIRTALFVPAPLGRLRRGLTEIERARRAAERERPDDPPERYRDLDTTVEGHGGDWEWPTRSVSGSGNQMTHQPKAHAPRAKGT